MGTTNRDETASHPERSLHRRTEKISEVVAREIVHDMRGLVPGTKLPSEAVMLENYRIGRASLREALRLLEVQGLIVIRPGPGGGPVVAAVESRHFAQMASLYFHTMGATYRNLVEARLVMEPVMARLAAERQDPTDIAELRDIMRVTETEAGAERQSDAWVLHSTSFHSLLAGMSGNPILDLIGRSLKDLFIDRFESIIFPREERRRVHDEHAAIVAAIVRGNGAKAEKLMRTHMEEYGDLAASRYPDLFGDVVDWR